MRTSDRDYSRLIKKAVLNYVDFDICKMVVDKFDNTKDQYYVIMMVEKPLKTSYREELQDYLNDMIPLTIYVSIADGMNCKKYMEIEYPKQLSESKIPPQVLRRHHLIDEMFEQIRSRYHRLFCNYRNPNILLGVLYERTLEDLYHAWFYQTVSDDDWDIASEYIQKYLINKYEKSTLMYWNNECNKGRSLNETETITGDTLSLNTMINKPVILTGDIEDKTKINNIEINNDGSVQLDLANGKKLNISQNRLRSFRVELDIPLKLNVKKRG